MKTARGSDLGRGALAVALGCVLVGFGGCRRDAAHTEKGAGSESATGSPAQTAGVPVDAATAGTVEGTVSFAGKPPARLQIDMSQDPVCAMTGGENLAEQYVVHDGKLASVYLYVKAGPPAAMHAAPATSAPVVLDQKGCRYTPHVVAVMHGGAVEFRNSDATMHNIHTMPGSGANATIDVSQGPQGKPEVHRFATPEVMLPVRCNNHPWMNAFINVSPTPFFAVTDAKGHFAIAGLPAGRYTLGAVHERLGEKEFEVEVKAKETARADLSLGPTK